MASREEFLIQAADLLGTKRLEAFEKFFDELCTLRYSLRTSNQDLWREETLHVEQLMNGFKDLAILLHTKREIYVRISVICALYNPEQAVGLALTRDSLTAVSELREILSRHLRVLTRENAIEEDAQNAALRTQSADLAAARVASRPNTVSRTSTSHELPNAAANSPGV